MCTCLVVKCLPMSILIGDGTVWSLARSLVEEVVSAIVVTEVVIRCGVFIFDYDD